LATLLLSQGVPMISHGDEVARTQRGNNNAYCQDNEISWIDWNLTQEQKALCEFVRQLIHIRLTQPVLRRRKYFQGRSLRGVKDLVWLAPDGREMTDEAWNADFVRSFGMLLPGTAIDELDERGAPITGDTLLILLNAHSDVVPFTMPSVNAAAQWQTLVDTFDPHSTDQMFRGAAPFPLQGRSLVVFRLTPPLTERRRNAAVHAAAADQPAFEPAVEDEEPVAVGEA
jgi:glycogen operon protein